MTVFTVHTVPASPFARAAMTMLEEKGADWRLSPMATADLKGPQHLALQPFGLMPAMTWDKGALYETQAILRFLDEALPGPCFTPDSLEGRMRMNQLIGICDSYLFPQSVRVIGFHRVVGPALFENFQPDEEAIAAAMPRSHTIFAELSRLLGDLPWFGGGAPSLADVLIGPHMAMLSRAPEWPELTRERANLGQWLARMEARPAMRATAPERLNERVAEAA